MSEDFIDPQHSIAAAISRRGFAVGASAIAAGLANSALAQSEQFGKPHPPLVSEDDPEIIASRPQLRPTVGGPFESYAAQPRTMHAKNPGVVVIQAIWGVDSQLRDVVRRFAKAGHLAIAPALYSRLAAPSGDGATDFSVFRPFAEKMNEQGFVQTDIAAAHDWIVAQSPGAKIGITGFCMGGGIVLKEVVATAIFSAAAPFYGAVKPVFDQANAIKTPLIGSYGARDTSILAQDVSAFFSRVTAPHDLKIYEEAGHAFFDDTRESYVASAASNAWQRVLAWFLTYLG
jgi:carboxymethylenebutenolidase